MTPVTKFCAILAASLLIIFGIGGCASSPQTKEEAWPATSKEILKKAKISYPVGRSSFFVVDPQGSTYSTYTPTYIPCKIGNFAKVVEISEHVVELTAFPKKSEGCYGILMTINTQSKTTRLVLYDYTGNPADVKQSFWLTNPRFSD